MPKRICLSLNYTLVNVLQVPISGVRHRKEFPGGEQAYLDSIPQNLYLAEVPIDTSVSFLSGKYKTLKANLNYNSILAQIRGTNVLAGEEPPQVSCDDCVGSVTRITIDNQTLEQDVAWSPCQEEGVYEGPGVWNSGSGASYTSLVFQSTENDLEGALFCPDGAISLQEIIGSLQEIGKSSFTLGMTIFATGYASKPFYHDYIVGLNRTKGTGAKASFKIGSFTYNCQYISAYQAEDNGFIGPSRCLLSIVNENFNSFDATFS